MKRKAMEIDKSKIDRREGSSRLPGGYSPTPGMGGISMDSPSSFQPAAPAKGMGISDRPSAAGGKKGPSKGMQLGKAKKGASDFLEAIAKVRGRSWTHRKGSHASRILATTYVKAYHSPVPVRTACSHPQFFPASRAT